METISERTGSLVVLRCWCGIQHAVPGSLRTEQLRGFNEGQTITPIYCPLGHQHFPAGETRVQQLEAQLTRERAKHDQTRAELRETEGRRRAERAAKTRLRKRIAAGVCPCCRRHFANVERHMQNQHPEFTGESD